MHRPLLGTPKTVTIIREADGWYAAISCAEVPTQPLPLTGQETGIDVGLKVFLITAEGEAVENPRHYRTAEKELQKAQRRLSRRKKGSKRRRKAVQVLAKKHQKVKRQRTTSIIRLRSSWCEQYDTIYLEDLQIANLSPAPQAGARRPWWLSAQWRQPQGGLEQVDPGCWVGSVPHNPRRQGSMRRPSSGSGATRLHQPGL